MSPRKLPCSCPTPQAPEGTGEPSLPPPLALSPGFPHSIREGPCFTDENAPFLPGHRDSYPFLMSYLIPGPCPQLSFPAPAHSSPTSGHPCTGRQISWGGVVWWGASGSRTGTVVVGKIRGPKGLRWKSTWCLVSWRVGSRARALRVGLKGGKQRHCLRLAVYPERPDSPSSEAVTSKVHPLLHLVLTFFFMVRCFFSHPQAFSFLSTGPSP